MNTVEICSIHSCWEEQVGRSSLTDVLLSVVCLLYHPVLINLKGCFKQCFLFICQTIKRLNTSSILYNFLPLFILPLLVAFLFQQLLKIFILDKECSSSCGVGVGIRGHRLDSRACSQDNTIVACRGNGKQS